MVNLRKDGAPLAPQTDPELIMRRGRAAVRRAAQQQQPQSVVGQALVVQPAGAQSASAAPRGPRGRGRPPGRRRGRGRPRGSGRGRGRGNAQAAQGNEDAQSDSSAPSEKSVPSPTASDAAAAAAARQRTAVRGRCGVATAGSPIVSGPANDAPATPRSRSAAPRRSTPNWNKRNDEQSSNDPLPEPSGPGSGKTTAGTPRLSKTPPGLYQPSSQKPRRHCDMLSSDDTPPGGSGSGNKTPNGADLESPDYHPDQQYLRDSPVVDGHVNTPSPNDAPVSGDTGSEEASLPHSKSVDKGKKRARDSDDNNDGSNGSATSKQARLSDQLSPCEVLFNNLELYKQVYRDLNGPYTIDSIIDANKSHNTAFEAIASVTEAINLTLQENHQPAAFALLDPESVHNINDVTHGPDFYPVINAEAQALIPVYCAGESGGKGSVPGMAHRGHVLLMVIDPPQSPLPNGRRPVQSTILDSYARSRTNHSLELLTHHRTRLHNEFRRTEHDVADSDYSEVHATLNAWAVAMDPRLARIEGRLDDAFYEDAVDVINLALRGTMDSKTIWALFECHGYIEPGQTLAASRVFKATRRFRDGDLRNHIAGHKDLEAWRNAYLETHPLTPCAKFRADLKKHANKTKLWAKDLVTFGQELDDVVVASALASVTEAINSNSPNDPLFSLVDQSTLELANRGAHFNAVVHPGRITLMPLGIGGSGRRHIALMIFRRDGETGLEAEYIDSSPKRRKDFGRRPKESRDCDRLARSLVAAGWAPNSELHAIRPKDFKVRVSSNVAERHQQHSRWCCGVHVILNGWAHALGLQLNRAATFGATGDHFYDEAVRLINFALQGHVSSETIEAFFECYGYVREGQSIKAGRQFARTVRFESDAALSGRVRGLNNETTTHGPPASELPHTGPITPVLPTAAGPTTPRSPPIGPDNPVGRTYSNSATNADEYRETKRAEALSLAEQAASRDPRRRNKSSTRSANGHGRYALHGSPTAGPSRPRRRNYRNGAGNSDENRDIEEAMARSRRELGGRTNPRPSASPIGSEDSDDRYDQEDMAQAVRASRQT